MKEWKKCPLFAALLMSFAILTMVGLWDTKTEKTEELSLVSAGASSNFGMLAGEIAKSGGNFQEEYEKTLSENLPVAVVLHKWKTGAYFKSPETLKKEREDKKDEDIPVIVLEPKPMESSPKPVMAEENVEPELEMEQAEEAAPELEQREEFTTVDVNYFNDGVFIGDSRIVGLQLYSGWENASFFAAKGMEVYSYFDKPYIKAGTVKMTVPQALAGQQFGKVYMMIGINEMGTGTHETFIAKYKEIIESIRQQQPQALIYVMGILYVDEEKSLADPIFNNVNIKDRNKYIQQMAEEMGLYYLDINEAICGTDEFLPKDYTSDGIHLKAEYIPIWTDYLLNHAILVDSPTA